jgi:hypothetical protein
MLEKNNKLREIIIDHPLKTKFDDSLMPDIL